MVRLLNGLRIVEVSAFIAAPYCGHTLAGLGAEVIRIDPPEGGLDFDRWPLSPQGGSLYFAGLNHLKRLETADLRSDAGREFVDRVITETKGGGIVLTNLSPKQLAFDRLKAIRTDVILVTLEGHRDGRTAVDYTVSAASGLPLLTGTEEKLGPINNPLPAWDLLAGLHMAVAILAAERLRSLTGEGAWIRLALADVMRAAMTTLGLVGEVQLGGQPRPALGNHLYGTFGHDFVTRDGARVMLVAITGRQWTALGEVTGLAAEFAGIGQRLGLDLANTAGRYHAREDIRAALDGWFAGRDFSELTAVFKGTAVCWEPYQTVSQLAGPGGGILGNPIFSEVDHPGVGRVSTVGPVFELVGEENNINR